MPDAYRENEPHNLEALHCWTSWLVWERVWSTQTAPDEPRREIGKFRLCVRRYQSERPEWVADTETEKARHRLPRCAGCKQYYRDTPLTRAVENPDRNHQQEIADEPLF